MARARAIAPHRIRPSLSEAITSRTLQWRILAFGGVCVALTGCLAAAAAMIPLHQELEERQDTSLTFAATTRAVAVQQFLAQARGVATQVSSRTKARKLLEAHVAGTLDAATARDGIGDILSDALRQSPNVLGITRLTRDGAVVAAVGKAPPSSVSAAATPALVDTEASIVGPLQLDGERALAIGSPILDRDDQRVGTDVILFATQELEQVVHDRSGLGQSGEVSLGRLHEGTITLLFAPRERGDHERSAGGEVIATGGLAEAHGLALDGARGVIARGTWVIAHSPVPSSPWSLTLRAPAREHYAELRGPVARVGGLVGLLVLLGVAGLIALLRPLTGKVILQTGALEAKVEARTEQLAAELEERRRAQQETQFYARQLEIRNAELDRSNKDLDDFAYVASHDLKEPLRGISNYASFLLEDYGGKVDEEGRDRIETLIKLSVRMKNLIDDLLRFSRIGRVDLEQEDIALDTLVDDVLESIEFTIAERNCEIRRPAPLPTVPCDPVRTKEVFRNLVVNGIKYNDRDAPWVEIGSRPPGEVAGTVPSEGPVFYVRDNGIGLRAKHTESIFRIFKRLHPRDAYGGGTGAGLTIVRKIVERHGGRVWVDSVEGEGSTFWFTLRAPSARPANDDDEDPHITPAHGLDAVV